MRRREWIRCTDAVRMLSEVAWLPMEDNKRRVRLFVLTAGRQLWTQIEGEVPQKAVAVAWRQAEGTAIAEEVDLAYDTLVSLYYGACAVESWETARRVKVLSSLLREPGSAAFELILPHSLVSGGQPVPLLTLEETNACCDLLRDIFGDRGSPLFIDQAFLDWNGGCVVKLATAIYEGQLLPGGALDNARLSVLADAMEEAGVTNTDILRHLRQQGAVHVKGCFALDLIREQRTRR